MKLKRIVLGLCFSGATLICFSQPQTNFDKYYAKMKEAYFDKDAELLDSNFRRFRFYMGSEYKNPQQITDNNILEKYCWSIIWMYELWGDEVKEKMGNPLPYLLEAEKRKINSSLIALGLTHYYGYWSDPDYKKAVFYFNKSYWSGSEEAANQLGIYHFEQTENYDSAIYYFKEAIRLAPPAQGRYSSFYATNCSWTAKSYFNKGDEKKAYEYYHQSLQFDPANLSAINSLANCWQEGWLGKDNIDSAQIYFEKAVNLWDITSLPKIIMLYQFYGCRKKFNISPELLSSILLNIEETGYFALMFSGVYIGINKDTASGIKMYQLGVNENYLPCIEGLADYYTFNCSPPKYKEAEVLYQRAARQNSNFAYYRLGEIYRDGNRGFPKDIKKAKEYFKKGCDNEDTNACTALKMTQ